MTKRQHKGHTKLGGHRTEKQPGAELQGWGAGWSARPRPSPQASALPLGTQATGKEAFSFLFTAPSSSPTNRVSGVYSVLSVPTTATSSLLNGSLYISDCCRPTVSWQECSKRVSAHIITTLLPSKQTRLLCCKASIDQTLSITRPSSHSLISYTPH